MEIAPALGKYGASRLPYTLPIGFFEQFPDVLMERIRVEGLINRATLADGPEISSREEIAGISALLAGLQTKNPYQVPEGYFDSLYSQMPKSEGAPIQEVLPASPTTATKEESSSRVPTTHQAPVVQFSRVIKYAVAACIVALLGLNLINLSYHKHQLTDPIQGLQAVSDQDMANYLDAYDVHWTPGFGNSSETASVEFNDTDIHELFSTVGDDELEQYMPALSEVKGTVN